ncbi:MAG: hypothetical protein LBF24_03185 [Puniceicoccales bacterium]|jgi:hypothetical protein|nr:hypothetical protein [Puniceicoccales bacterium]
MNDQQMCAIPRYDFRACDAVKRQYNVLALEHFCSWIREVDGAANKIFDYAEVRRQILSVKTRFSEEVQKYVLACYEPLFAKNVLLPKILSWPGEPNVSLVAILYTMPVDATPRHLLSAVLDRDQSTREPNGAILMKARIEYAVPYTYAAKIKNFMDPMRAEIERCD